MKNLFFLLLSLVFSLNGITQPQRLTIQTGSYEISSGKPAIVKTYCADWDRIVNPSDKLEYNVFHKKGNMKIIIDGKEYKGDIEDLTKGENPVLLIHTEGSDAEDNITIKIELNPNNPRKDVKIDFLTPSTIGNTKGDNLNIYSHIISTNFKFEEINQQKYWIIIEILKHIDGAKQLKLNSNNVFTPKTKALFDEYFKNYQTISDIFKKYKINIPFLQRPLPYEIKKFQEVYGLNPTGWADRETVTFLEEYISILERIKSPNHEDVFNLSNNNYIVKVKDKYEIWEDNYVKDDAGFPVFLSNIYSRKIFNNDVIDKVTLDNFNSLKKYSQTEAPQFLSFSISPRNNKDKTVQFSLNGDEPSTIKWENPNSYDEIFTALMPMIKDRDGKDFLFCRDIISQSGFSKNEKANAADKYGSIFLTEKLTEDRSHINTVEFIRQLYEYSGKKMSIGGKLETDIINMTFVPMIQKGEDIAALISPKSFGIELEPVKKMQQELLDVNVKVHELDLGSSTPENIKESNVIVISGHNKAIIFENYVKELTNKGLFNEKIVLVFTCFEKGTSSLNTYMIKGGARQVIFFPSKIHPNAVTAVIREMNIILKSMDGTTQLTMKKLLEKSTENALKNIENDNLINELNDVLKFIGQYSYNQNK